MEKFLKELAKADLYTQHVPTNTEAQEKYKELYMKFKELTGQKALYKCKSERINRVVTVERAYPSYVLLSYRHYSKSGWGSIRTAVTYGALICGDDYVGDADV